jgi:hypothetical protein
MSGLISAALHDGGQSQPGNRANYRTMKTLPGQSKPDEPDIDHEAISPLH